MFVTSNRMKQVDDLQAANDKYGTQHKDTDFWLGNMERRVDQARPHVKDKAAIQARLKELKVLTRQLNLQKLSKWKGGFCKWWGYPFKIQYNCDI